VAPRRRANLGTRGVRSVRIGKPIALINTRLAEWMYAGERRGRWRMRGEPGSMTVTGPCGAKANSAKFVGARAAKRWPPGRRI